MNEDKSEHPIVVEYEMSRVVTQIQRTIALLVFACCMPICLFHLFGGLLFLASSSLWDFVPPVVLLGVLALVT